MQSKRRTTTSRGVGSSKANTPKSVRRSIEDSDTDVDMSCDENIQEEYEVERVIGKKFDDRGDISYNLKWKNYEETTWERKENCNCSKLIDSYESLLNRRHGETLGYRSNDKARNSTSPPASSSSNNNRRSSGSCVSVMRRTSGRLR